MKKITKKEIKTILVQHKLWLDSNETEGKRAILRCANLSGADLSDADLSDADLTYANLIGANLYNADLRRADLRRANLYGANLRYADLTSANLYGANLYGADLTGANLSGADLTNADLTSANLYRANLTCVNLTDANLFDAILTDTDLTSANLTCADLTDACLEYANLTDTILDEKEQCRKGIVLTEPIIGYKKAYGGKIITLEIPVGAKVFSISNDKRRTNKCKVIDMQGETELSSIHDNYFKYHVGDEINIIDFDENYNVECGEGIHFFLTREEAEKY